MRGGGGGGVWEEKGGGGGGEEKGEGGAERLITGCWGVVIHNPTLLSRILPWNVSCWQNATLFYAHT